MYYIIMISICVLDGAVLLKEYLFCPQQCANLRMQCTLPYLYLHLYRSGEVRMLWRGVVQIGKSVPTNRHLRTKIIDLVRFPEMRC